MMCGAGVSPSVTPASPRVALGTRMGFFWYFNSLLSPFRTSSRRNRASPGHPYSQSKRIWPSRLQSGKNTLNHLCWKRAGAWVSSSLQASSLAQHQHQLSLGLGAL